MTSKIIAGTLTALLGIAAAAFLAAFSDMRFMFTEDHSESFEEHKAREYPRLPLVARDHYLYRDVRQFPTQFPLITMEEEKTWRRDAYRVICEAVRERLDVPSSAQFAPLSEAKIEASRDFRDNTTYIVRATAPYEAADRAGVSVRGRMRALARLGGGNWRVSDVEIIKRPNFDSSQEDEF